MYFSLNAQLQSHSLVIKLYFTIKQRDLAWWPDWLDVGDYELNPPSDSCVPCCRAPLLCPRPMTVAGCACLTQKGIQRNKIWSCFFLIAVVLWRLCGVKADMNSCDCLNRPSDFDQQYPVLWPVMEHRDMTMMLRWIWGHLVPGSHTWWWR